jgi:hypothetical protein
MSGRMSGGRMSALMLAIDGRSAVEFKPFTGRTPLLSLAAGHTLVTLALPERLRPADVEFARLLADQAARFAAEVERLYRGSGASSTAGGRSGRSPRRGRVA